jgi:hypothetical protein
VSDDWLGGPPNSLALPPVNRASDPFLCNHGVAATFDGPQGQITLSLLCELPVGHDGNHYAEGAGAWVDESL